MDSDGDPLSLVSLSLSHGAGPRSSTTIVRVYLDGHGSAAEYLVAGGTYFVSDMALPCARRAGRSGTGRSLQPSGCGPAGACAPQRIDSLRRGKR